MMYMYVLLMCTIKLLGASSEGVTDVYLEQLPESSRRNQTYETIAPIRTRRGAVGIMHEDRVSNFTLICRSSDGLAAKVAEVSSRLMSAVCCQHKGVVYVRIATWSDALVTDAALGDAISISRCGHVPSYDCSPRSWT